MEKMIKYLNTNYKVYSDEIGKKRSVSFEDQNYRDRDINILHLKLIN